MLGTILFSSTLMLTGWLFWIIVRSQRSLPSSDADTTALENILAAVIAAVIVTTWLGLVLAEVGAFSLLALTGLLLLVALGLVAWLRWRRVSWRPSIALRLDRYDVCALFLAIPIAILYARPAEWVVGGEDPGVYVNTGVNIARSGAIIIHDQTLADLDLELANVLSQNSGIYMRDRENGVLLPQFFHAFQVWGAIFYDLGGVRLTLMATPFFGWLSVLAFYLLGRRLIHPGAGLLATALLAVNISQLWYARNAFADIVVQFYLLSGFWMLAVWTERVEREHPGAVQAALWSGACFGLSHLVKVDVFVTPAVVLGWVAYNWLRGTARRSHAYFLAVYLPLVAHAALHGHLFSPLYVSDLLRRFSSYVQLGLKGLVVLLPLLLFAVWQRARLARLVVSLGRRRRVLGQIFVLFVLLLSLYGYFVRPLRADLGEMEEEDFDRQGAVMNWLRPLATEPNMKARVDKAPTRTFIEEGIVRVGWYLNPVGIWLGIAGFLYWVTADLRPKSAPFLGGAFLASVVLFYRGTLVPNFFWAFKRYVPLVVPAFMLFITYLLRQLWPTDRSRWQRAILPLTIGCFLLVSYVWGSLMFWEHIEWEGAVEDVAALADSLPEEAVLLFKRSNKGYRIGLPLTFIHGRDLYLIEEDHEADPRLRQVIAGWHEQGRPVYWITPDCSPLPDYHPFFQMNDVQVSWPRVAHGSDKLPDRFYKDSAHICIYHVAGTDTEHALRPNVNFDHQINLLGHELDKTRVAPGDEIHLNLYWQAQQALEVDYTVFTHVLDEGLAVWGQRDSQPARGSRPTSGWEVDEVVRDAIAIPIRPDVPPGTYRLHVGLYDLATMERLFVLDTRGEPTGDYVLLDSIEVVVPDQAASP